MNRRVFFRIVAGGAVAPVLRAPVLRAPVVVPAASRLVFHADAFGLMTKTVPQVVAAPWRFDVLYGMAVTPDSVLRSDHD